MMLCIVKGQSISQQEVCLRRKKYHSTKRHEVDLKIFSHYVPLMFLQFTLTGIGHCGSDWVTLYDGYMMAVSSRSGSSGSICIDSNSTDTRMSSRGPQLSFIGGGNGLSRLTMGKLIRCALCTSG